MPGKHPREREHYMLYAGNGTVVEVTREVYLEWYRFRRQERYQKEKERKHHVASLEAAVEKGAVPERTSESAEDAAIQELCREKLRLAIAGLKEADACLLRLLFYDGLTVTEAAQACGCSRKTIANRRKRILLELKEKLKGSGIENSFV